MFFSGQSSPLELIELGLGSLEYYEIADNVGRVLKIHDKWQDILDRANEELPESVRDAGMRLCQGMDYDKSFFRKAGLDYAKGSPAPGCFFVAVVDYMLTNKDKLKPAL
jgi:hypothetical protein